MKDPWGAEAQKAATANHFWNQAISAQHTISEVAAVQVSNAPQATLTSHTGIGVSSAGFVPQGFGSQIKLQGIGDIRPQIRRNRIFGVPDHISDHQYQPFVEQFLNETDDLIGELPARQIVKIFVARKVANYLLLVAANRQGRRTEMVRDINRDADINYIRPLLDELFAQNGLSEHFSPNQIGLDIQKSMEFIEDAPAHSFRILTATSNTVQIEVDPDLQDWQARVIIGLPSAARAVGITDDRLYEVSPQEKK